MVEPQGAGCVPVHLRAHQHDVRAEPGSRQGADRVQVRDHRQRRGQPPATGVPELALGVLLGLGAPEPDAGPVPRSGRSERSRQVVPVQQRDRSDDGRGARRRPVLRRGRQVHGVAVQRPDPPHRRQDMRPRPPHEDGVHDEAKGRGRDGAAPLRGEVPQLRPFGPVARARRDRLQHGPEVALDPS